MLGWISNGAETFTTLFQEQKQTQGIDDGSIAKLATYTKDYVSTAAHDFLNTKNVVGEYTKQRAALRKKKSQHKFSLWSFLTRLKDDVLILGWLLHHFHLAVLDHTLADLRIVRAN